MYYLMKESEGWKVYIPSSKEESYSDYLQGTFKHFLEWRTHAPLYSKTNLDSISSPVFAFRIHFYFDILFEVFYYHTLKRYMKPYPFFSDTESQNYSNFYYEYCVEWFNVCSVDLLSGSPRFETRKGYMFDLA